jgi:hypothetical protein
MRLFRPSRRLWQSDAAVGAPFFIGHCEERSDEAIHLDVGLALFRRVSRSPQVDCFAPLAMTAAIDADASG